MNHKKTETNPYGAVTEFVNDRFGNPVLIALEKSLQRNEYDFWGRTIKQTDPKGYETRTVFNARGQPIRIAYPTGEERFLYSLKGNLIEHIDLDQTKTVYEYDDFDRVCKKTIYSSAGEKVAEETKTHGAFLLDSETDLEGYKTEYTYDHAGRKIKASREGRTTTYTYDPLGHLHTTALEDLEIVTMRDCLGRTETEEKKNGKGDVLERKKRKYDQRGLALEEICNFAGQEVVFKTDYDAFERVKESADPLGHKTTIHYSTKPHTKITVDPLKRKRIETYNPRGKLASLEKQDSSGNTIALEEYDYDLNDNLAQQTSSVYFEGKILQKVITTWDYGPGNRLEKFTEAYGTQIARTTKYEYTSKGLLERVIKPDGEILEYSYDPLGHQKTLKNSDFSIHYLYNHDRVGHLISMTDLTTGLMTKRQVDPFGNIEQEELANGFTIKKRYDALDQCRLLILPDASLVEKTYDGTHLREVIHRNSQSCPIYSHQFLEYDLSGNLLKEALPLVSGQVTYKIDTLGRFYALQSPFFTQTIEEFDAVGKIKKMTLNGQNKGFSYDDLGQLIREDEETFAYDSEYNRRRHNTQEYEIDALYQLKRTPFAEFTHDLLGNVKTKMTPEGICIFGYDPLDRLTYFKNAEGIETFYTYDPLHRRLTKTTCNSITRYLYDGQNEIGFEKDREFSLRVLGDTPSAEIGATIALHLNGHIYVPINDLQGNITTLYDPTKRSLLEETCYTAFGVETSTSKTSPWRYLSKHTDAESGLVYFGRRYYDPSIGRWLTTDPKGYTDSMNLYAFALNDPFMLVDPYGLESNLTSLSKAGGVGFLEGASQGFFHPIDSSWSLSGDLSNLSHSTFAWDFSSHTSTWQSMDWDQRMRLISFKAGQAAGLIGAATWAVPKGSMSLLQGAWRGAGIIASEVRSSFAYVASRFASRETSVESLRLSAARYTVREAAPVGSQLLSLTEKNFRQNLIRLTGLNPMGKEAHHVIPKQFLLHPTIKERSLNVHNPRFGVWVDRALHQQIHKEGYNLLWEQFLKSTPTREEILDFGRTIMSDYGITSMNL